MRGRHSMCSHSHAPTTAADLVSKRRWPAEVQQALERFERDFGSGLTETMATIADAVEDRQITVGVERVIRQGIADNREELSLLLRDGVADGARAGRAMASRRFGLDIDFETVPESTLNELVGVVEDLEDGIFETIGDGVASDVESMLSEGADVDDIADRLRSRDYAETLDNRHTQTHARTLVQGASERGNHSAMKDAPGVVGERWNVTLDGRQRPSHEAADGQIAPVDGTFSVGGARLLHPGDPGGPVDEVANCRCYATPVFEDDLTADELARLRAGNRLL